MKTKTIIRKTLSVILALVFIFIFIPVSSNHAAESETVTYLALGDSISTGYGLAGYTSKKHSPEGFTYQIAADLGYKLINKAVDGNKSADILNQLNNPLNANYVAEADLAKADVITITAGGNDMMALLYAKTAELTSSPNDTAANIVSKLHNGDPEVLAAVINILTESSDNYILNDPDFQPAIHAVIANLNAIVAKIKSVNSHAQIVVATQYNPYAEFENAVLLNLSLSDVYKGTEAGVTALNTAIKDNAVDKENGNAVRYTVADVKAAFDAYQGGEDLYNAQPPAGSTAMNVDFHPTAAGHDLLTVTFKQTFSLYEIVPHECEHTGGTATCKDKAICVMCGEEYGGNPPHIDADENGKCDICNHEAGGSSVDDPTNNGDDETGDSSVDDPANNGDDETGDSSVDDPTNHDGLETWVTVLIAVGSALVLACGGFAVYWFVIRKRRR